MASWLLENTLMACGLTVIIAVVCRLNRRRPAFCHLLWVLAFVALIAPPLPLPFSPGATLRAELGEFVSGDSIDKSATIEALTEEFATLDPVLLGELDLATEPAAAQHEPERVASSAPVLGWLTNSSWHHWLFALWAAGSSFALLRAVKRVLWFRKQVGHALAAPGDLNERVAEVARRMGVSSPEVRLLAGVGTPAIWCLGRSVMLWPTNASGLSLTPTQPSLIAHELAHLIRKDHWIARLEPLAISLLWWNPLFWLIRREIHQYAELSCDAWALWAYPSDRRAFAEALIDVQAETLQAQVPLQGLCATTSDFKNFERRLNMIMQSRVSRSVSKKVASLAIVSTLLVLPGFSDGKSSDGGNECSAQATEECIQGLVSSRKLFKQAEGMFAEGKFEGALACYEKVLAHDPSHGMAHARIGYILIGAGEYAHAIEVLEAEIELGHGVPTAAYNIACAAARAGDEELALQSVQRAVRRGFDNFELMSKDGDLESIRGEAAFVKALELSKESQRRRAIVRSLDEESAPEEALAAYASLVEIVSEDGELLDIHGRQLLIAGDYSTAASAFTTQAKIGFKPGTALYNLACAHSLAGDVEAGIKALELAVKLKMAFGGVAKDADLDNLRSDPRFEALQEEILAPATFQKRLSYAIQNGDYVEAVGRLEKLLANPEVTDMTRGWANLELGYVAQKMGDTEAALVHYQSAVAADYAVDSATFAMACAYANLGDKQRAAANAGFAIDLGYADVEELENLLGKWKLVSKEEAEKMLEHASWNRKELKYKKQKQAEQEQRKEREGEAASGVSTR